MEHMAKVSLDRTRLGAHRFKLPAGCEMVCVRVSRSPVRLWCDLGHKAYFPIAQVRDGGTASRSGVRRSCDAGELQRISGGGKPSYRKGMVNSNGCSFVAFQGQQ